MSEYLGAGYRKKVKIFGVIPLYETTFYDLAPKRYDSDSLGSQNIPFESLPTTQDAKPDDTINREFWDF